MGKPLVLRGYPIPMVIHPQDVHYPLPMTRCYWQPSEKVCHFHKLFQENCLFYKSISNIFANDCFFFKSAKNSQLFVALLHDFKKKYFSPAAFQIFDTKTDSREKSLKIKTSFLNSLRYLFIIQKYCLSCICLNHHWKIDASYVCPINENLKANASYS
jgi:hypothetical protein